MTAGLVAYDLLYVLVSLGFYGGAGRAAMEIARRLSEAGVSGWLALPAAVLGFLLTLLTLAFAACLVLPRPTPGTWTMMRGAPFYGWLLRSMVRRVVFLGPLKPALFSVNALRFLALRAQGARVAFTANVSSDAELLDPALLTLGPRATVGARCLISGHYVVEGRLVLDRVEVGAGTLLAADVAVMPGVHIGARVMVEPQAAIGRDAVVGEGARIGRRTVLDLGVQVPAGARVPAFEVIRARGDPPNPPGAGLAPPPAT